MALYTALAAPISVFEYYDNKHGYQVFRRIELYENEAELPKGWNGIQRLVKVQRWGTRKQVPFYERSFYILSKPIHSAQQVAKAIQGHWAIENNLHWTKDVMLKEDNMSLKDKNEVTILVYLNNTALNLIRMAGYKPIKDTFAKFSNKVNELYKLFQNNSET